MCMKISEQNVSKLCKIPPTAYIPKLTGITIHTDIVSIFTFQILALWIIDCREATRKRSSGINKVKYIDYLETTKQCNREREDKFDGLFEAVPGPGVPRPLPI